jgi:hypothetical protein
VVRCFVIGPIGDQLADAGSLERQVYEDSIQVFEEVIKAACGVLDIEAYRADDIDEPGEIPEQIFEALRDEELVIADLTGANPNVMYELGVRHVLGKCTLQIGEKGRLPFDVSTIRTIQFLRSPHGIIKARKQLTKMIGSSLANGCKPSTVSRVLAEGAGSTGADGTPDDTGDAGTEDSGGQDAAEDEGPPGFLDALADVELATPDLTERLASMSMHIEAIGSLARASNEEAEHSTTAGQRLAILKRFNKKVTEVVRAYDQELLEFEGRVAVLGAAIDVVLNHVVEGDARKEASGYLNALVQMGESARESREEGIQPFHRSVGGLEDLSRETRPVIRLLTSDLDRTISAFREVERWGQRASDLLSSDEPS